MNTPSKMYFWVFGLLVGYDGDVIVGSINRSALRMPQRNPQFRYPPCVITATLRSETSYWSTTMRRITSNLVAYPRGFAYPWGHKITPKKIAHALNTTRYFSEPVYIFFPQTHVRLFLLLSLSSEKRFNKIIINN